MKIYENKNCLVCDLDDFSDGMLFKYAHVYNNSYSFLTPEIIHAMTFFLLLIYLWTSFFWPFRVKLEDLVVAPTGSRSKITVLI